VAAGGIGMIPIMGHNPDMGAVVRRRLLLGLDGHAFKRDDFRVLTQTRTLVLGRDGGLTMLL